MKKLPLIYVTSVNDCATDAYINLDNVCWAEKNGKKYYFFFNNGKMIEVRRDEVEDDLREFWVGGDNEIYRLQCQIDELKEQLAAHKRKGHDPFAAD